MLAHFFMIRDEVNCPLLVVFRLGFFCVGLGFFGGWAGVFFVGLVCLLLLLYFDPVCESRLC